MGEEKINRIRMQTKHKRGGKYIWEVILEESELDQLESELTRLQEELEDMTKDRDTWRNTAHIAHNNIRILRDVKEELQKENDTLHSDAQEKYKNFLVMRNERDKAIELLETIDGQMMRSLDYSHLHKAVDDFLSSLKGE